jgi:hypothetical protein
MNALVVGRVGIFVYPDNEYADHSQEKLIDLVQQVENYE